MTSVMDFYALKYFHYQVIENIVLKKMYLNLSQEAEIMKIWGGNLIILRNGPKSDSIT